MTNGGSGEPWRYPALGFDPLPGDPEIIEALAVDAGIFGERMVECAAVLRRAGTPEGWQGKDADAFADELGELPRDLDRCGLAFQGLKEDLNSYHRLFVAWKQKAIDLECDADVEERTIREAKLAGPAPSSPTISAAAAVLAAPGPIIGPAPPNPAEEAEARLEAIRAEARALSGQFNRAVQGLATSIEELVEYAPKKPGRSWLDRVGGVVGDVVELGLRMTPIGLAVTAIQLADRLIEELGPFLDELSNLLSSMSSFLGFASALFMWAPGIGPGLAAAALITAGGAAAVKTGLYLSGAKDEYGRPYVSGAELRGAYIDVAIEGAGAALGAGAKALNKSETLVSAMKTEFNVVEKLTGMVDEVGTVGRLGVGEAAGEALAKTAQQWGSMGVMEKGATAFVTAVGVAEPTVSPTLKGDKADLSNWGDWKSVGSVWDSGWNAVVNQPDPDAVKPVMAD